MPRSEAESEGSAVENDGAGGEPFEPPCDERGAELHKEPLAARRERMGGTRFKPQGLTVKEKRDDQRASTACERSERRRGSEHRK